MMMMMMMMGGGGCLTVPSFQCPSAEWILFLVRHVHQTDPEELHKFQMKSKVYRGGKVTADGCADAATNKKKPDIRISVQNSYFKYTNKKCQ